MKKEKPDIEEYLETRRIMMEDIRAGDLMIEGSRVLKVLEYIDFLEKELADWEAFVLTSAEWRC